MGLKRCDNCEEMVDEAKAFCPGCGNAFVEEETREASDFEKMDSTVQLGNTMYNQMLSDMGLNISKSAPPPPEKRIEVIKPAVSASSLKVPVQKAAPAQTPQPPKQGISSTTKWLILAGFILVVGLLILLAAVVLLYMFWPRIA